MKRLISLIIGLFRKNKRNSTSYTAKCKHVFDGDSFSALKDGDTEPFEIRLYGIDAPERGQEYAKQSREELIKLIRNKSIRVEVMDTDRYGRTVAKVFRNGLYINLELLKRGLAWFYSYHAGADDELRQAQEYARAHKNGLWQSDTPISPRKRRKSNPSTRHKGVK